jgi:hypothetical protein
MRGRRWTPAFADGRSSAHDDAAHGKGELYTRNEEAPREARGFGSNDVCDG